MKLKFFTLITILYFFAGGCSFFSEYPGYSRTWSGVYYKLITIGENDIKPKIGDYITIDIVYKTLKDSVFFTGRRKFQVTQPDFKGSIDECFLMISIGEKYSFIISAEDFFKRTLETNVPKFLTSDSKIKVEILMDNIQTEKQYRYEKEAFLKWIDDFGEFEKEILKQYITENKISLKPLPSGLMYLSIKRGNGKKVFKGDTIVVDYEGRFLNGKFFDSTIKRNEAFQFVYGTEWQVIPGLEEAIGLMEEGEKALVIIPSELAFGTGGSSTGIIPPFTSLIFEVDLRKVN